MTVDHVANHQKIYLFFESIYVTNNLDCIAVNRKLFLQHRSTVWFDDVLMNAEDDRWIDHFRLPRREIENISQMLSEDLAPSEAYIRQPVPLFKRVCIAIYKLASCAEYRVVAEQFGVSKQTVFRCLNAFVISMTSKHQEFIKFPTTQEAKEIATRIANRHGYIQTFGAIDGSHICINPPADGLADYQNRKMYPSIVLQGLVDDKFMFRDVSCKCPGSMHDSNVFANSSLSTRILSEEMLKDDCIVDGAAIPLHIIGDSPYPLTLQVMKGYVGRNLSPAQENFNVYLSSARMMVANTFGRLKSRWRMVSKRMVCRVELTPYVIMTCCCLHNVCDRSKVPIIQATIDEVLAQPQNQHPPQAYDQHVEPGAAEVREATIEKINTSLK